MDGPSRIDETPAPGADGALDDTLLLGGLLHLCEDAEPGFLTDATGRIAHANGSLHTILPALEAAAPGLLDGWIAEALASEEGAPGAWVELAPLEETVTLADGRREAIGLRAALLRGDDGAPRLLCGRLLRRAADPGTASADDQLATLRARFEDIVRLVTDWVWETDRSLRLTYVSQRVSETLGRHPRQLLGMRLTELGDSPRLAETLEADWRRPFRDLEVEIRDHEGAPHLFRLSAVPCYGADGAFAGYRGTAHDVTRERMRERAILQAKEAAESANRAKSEFLAAISHELRTPLNAVIGFSEVMMTEAFGPVGQAVYAEYARDIHDSAAHLLELINDILDVSKIEAGKLRLDEEETDLVDLIRSAARLVEARATENGVALTVSVAPDLPEVTLDPRAFKQVILNLLSNAVKFTESGGRVALGAAVAPDGAFVLTVEDSGIGMSEDEIGVALTAFGQVDSSLARKFQGTGLGLPLTKGLVELHGGELGIESRKPGGTVVSVRLPAWRVCRDRPALGTLGA